MDWVMEWREVWCLEYVHDGGIECRRAGEVGAGGAGARRHGYGEKEMHII